MEVLVEQLTIETRRSFNPLASVEMMRFDLSYFGEVLPETLDRIRDEELSYLAEGIDMASRTTFALKRQDEQLMYFDKGDWRPYVGTLIAGLEVAEQEAMSDPRKSFLADWAREDMAQGYHMQALRPGEQAVWYSSYAHQQEALYGKAFMESCGLIPERQMGFLYRAVCEADGTVVLESQTIDRSDTDGFEAAIQAATDNPQIDLDELVECYDARLENKLGGKFYAGRHNSEIDENAWDTIREQSDLVAFFLDGIERLAISELEGWELERATKKHVYGAWAAFKKRIETGISSRVVSGGRQNYDYDRLMLEVGTAFNEFAAEGRVLVGCGGAITILKGETDIMNASGEAVFSTIFGDGPVDDKYGSLTFRCQKGHENTRPRNRQIPRCKQCGISVKC